jgi:DNA-binding TFAR19-related protein (PDSD5 family)
MASRRLYEFAPGAGIRRIEVRLETTRLTQRRQGPNDEWEDSTTDFSNHAEARASFEQICSVYERRGRLLDSVDDQGAAQLKVADTGPGAVEVVDDWLLEEGPRLLGDELFELYRAGGLPLGFEGRTLVAATVANVAVPTSSRLVYHPHFLMAGVLARPIAKTLKRLCFVERERQHDDEPGRSVPGELAAAVRTALRSEVGPLLEAIEAGSFEQPGEGKPRLSELSRCTGLRALRMVFERGFAWKGVETAMLERLEVGNLSAGAQLAPFEDLTFPVLETLGVAVSATSNLLPEVPAMLTRDRFPALRRLELVLARATDGAIDPEPAEADLETQAQGTLRALLQHPLLERLTALRLAMPLALEDVDAHRSRLARLERLELDLPIDEVNFARELFPRFVPLR